MSHTIRPSTELKLGRIFDTGKWQVDFSDSSTLIDFGKNDLGLLPLKGKYTSLEQVGFLCDRLFPLIAWLTAKWSLTYKTSIPILRAIEDIVW